MRRLSAIFLVLACGACAHARPPAAPDLRATERLAAADRLVQAGCYDCLIAAYREFDALRRNPVLGAAAGLRSISTAALVALRERELGMADSGHLDKARDALGQAAGAPADLSTVLEVVDLLPGSSLGPSHPPDNDIGLARASKLRANRDKYAGVLRDLAPEDPLSAYIWASFMCGSIEARDVDPDDIFTVISGSRDQQPATNLIAFRRATCRDLDKDRLEALLAREPRFVEASYLLGRIAVGRRDLDGAQKLFEQAYAWHPRWPALTTAMANIAMTAEEFGDAARYYDETLALDPFAADAKLGKVRALTYLARREDAIAVADQMVASRWYVGDARYWRALNEAQTQQYDAAWADVEEAGKLLMNAEVPKLAGIVAYRRGELDAARTRFETSRTRNPGDCETGFYLGLVLADQRRWPQTADVLVATGQCLDSMERRLMEEIAQVRSSSDPPVRKERQIARREREIAGARRMRATSWFNIAVAYFSLSQPSEARQYAERVIDDEQFGERAKEILSRLK
ncbi:MAG TPA: tetratricopeptide repeat protein [Vicinamibacterales bacterium]|jgi:tetratricopeptide (TPR) repeat protein